MKKLFAAALVLSVMASAAAAKCSVPSLNGNWLISDAGGGGATATPIAFSGGTATIGTDSLVITSLSASTCTGFVAFKDNMGVTVALGTISANSVAANSPATPNQLNINLAFSGFYQMLTLTRA